MQGASSIKLLIIKESPPSSLSLVAVAKVRGSGMNTLYYGDNLEIMRTMPSNFIDLIYLDPPFNSKATYNVFYPGNGEGKSKAQLTVFEDTWHWSEKAEFEYAEILKYGNEGIAEIIKSFREFMQESQMMAYLVMMTSRLIEMHRILKDTGSIYLHCDPTASHYIKIGMDGIFGHKNFRNEISWKRYAVHSLSLKGFDKIVDIILLYSKDYEKMFFRRVYGKSNDIELRKKFPHLEKETNRYYQHVALEQSANSSSAGQTRIIQSKTIISALGWRWSQQTFNKRLKDNPHLIHWTKNQRPRYKIYENEYAGVPIGSLWTDIFPISSNDSERLNYPTQKPIALLDRIIQASSNEGDLVFDPFCGCGTTIYSAIKNRRNWMGCDITHLAITMMEKRFKEAYNTRIKYQVIGNPLDFRSAQDLASRDRYEFEYWACGLVGANPSNDKKKGADGGYDGFINAGHIGREKVLVEVKSGKNIGIAMLRSFIEVVNKQKASIGIFISLYPPTKDMKKEATSCGFYEHPSYKRKYLKIQIITILELLNGKSPDFPEEVISKKNPRESNLFQHPQQDFTEE